MLAEGEVRFSCVRYKDGVEEEEEVSGRGQTFLLLFFLFFWWTSKRDREKEGDVLCHTHNNSRWKNLTTATA